MSRLLSLVVIAASGLGTASALAAPKPSFNCAKATSVAEKAICADDQLAKADAGIAKRYTELGKALDAKSGEALAKDQKYFVHVRDASIESETDKAERARLLKIILDDRLGFLKSIEAKPADGLVGEWGNVEGGVTVERLADGTLKASLSTTQPVDARWVCQAEGSGKPTGNVLDFAIEGGEEGERLTLTTVGPLLGVDAVGAGGQPQASASYCGLNGSVAGWYFKVRSGR